MALWALYGLCTGMWRTAGCWELAAPMTNAGETCCLSAVACRRREGGGGRGNVLSSARVLLRRCGGRVCGSVELAGLVVAGHELSHRNGARGRGRHGNGPRSCICQPQL